MKIIKSAGLLALYSLIATGCSTVTGSGSSQSISLQTFTSDSKEVAGVKCDLVNDEGKWFVSTPGSVVVHRSNKDLQVVCKKEGVDDGSASVVSRTTGNMFGNILLGGGIGAIIDHNNGTAYEYPTSIKVFMGKMNQRIDEKTPAEPLQTVNTTAQK